MSTSRPDRLADYLEAKKHDDAANAAMAKAECLFGRLARTMPESRAYDLAGVALADRRSLQTSADLRAATAALIESLGDRRWIGWHLIASIGALTIAGHLRTPANANFPRKSRSRTSAAT